MRNKLFLVALGVLVGAIAAKAEEKLYAKRVFEISKEDRNLVDENAQVTFQQEETVQAHRREPDLSFGFFVGQMNWKAQTVKLGEVETPYDADSLISLGIDVKKDLYRKYAGLGLQLEYSGTTNDIGTLHIVPATGYFYGRTRGFTKVDVRAIAEAGYSHAYIRQLGTASRTGGLQAGAGFWQAGLEVPLTSGREQWSLGVFYSERFEADGDADLSGETFKVQGAITL